MKYFIFFLFAAISLLFSCTKTCTAELPACSEKPETGTVCQATFNRWFYNENTSECDKIAYSGCEELGFDSQEDCEKCDCR